LDSEGFTRWIAYEVIPTQSEGVVIAGDFPNSAMLGDSAIYRQRLNFRKDGTKFNFQFFKEVNSQQVEIGGVPFAGVGGQNPGRDKFPLVASELAQDFLAPGNVVRSASNPGWNSTRSANPFTTDMKIDPSYFRAILDELIEENPRVCQALHYWSAAYRICCDQHPALRKVGDFLDNRTFDVFF
jgi:hypothetical protein